MCAYLQHASSKEKKNCLPELFFPPQCVEFKSAGHSKKKSPQPAGGGARFLISLPPHRLTPRDSCFPRTHSLCRSLSYSRRFCSHSSSLARSFTLFQVSHRLSFVSLFGFALILSSDASLISCSRVSSSPSPSSSSFSLSQLSSLTSTCIVRDSEIWMKSDT